MPYSKRYEIKSFNPIKSYNENLGLTRLYKTVYYQPIFTYFLFILFDNYIKHVTNSAVKFQNKQLH